MYNKREIGSEKEMLAAEYLKKKGYFIIEKNYHVRQAELDIIARDESTIVFVEVKYRKNTSSGHPFEAVGIQKQRRICKAALFYMNQKKISPDNTSIRFDVVGIIGDKIEHLKNAFDYIM